MSVEVEGADQFAALARQLKEAGDRGLQREMSQAISRATRPAKAALQESARTTLPKRGGLAREIAASQFRTRRANGPKGVGIRITARGRFSLWHLDQGIVRHPGGEDQPIRPGWWETPVEASAPAVRHELVTAMDAVAARIGRGL